MEHPKGRESGPSLFQLAGIYAILDAGKGIDSEALLDEVIGAGVRIVQYRSKSGVDRALLRRLHERTRAAHALLIVNDDAGAAGDADGVHVGQEDLGATGVGALRARLAGKVLGISCGTAEEARAAERGGADYVGAGPFAATINKDDAGPAIGAEGIARIARAVHIPVAAIGGIGLPDLQVVRRSGAVMAAVISAIERAPDRRVAAPALVLEWERLSQMGST